MENLNVINLITYYADYFDLLYKDAKTCSHSCNRRGAVQLKIVLVTVQHHCQHTLYYIPLLYHVFGGEYTRLDNG